MIWSNSSSPTSVSSGQISSWTTSVIQSRCSWNSGSVEKSHAMPRLLRSSGTDDTRRVASSARAVVGDFGPAGVGDGELVEDVRADLRERLVPALVALAGADGPRELVLPRAVGAAGAGLPLARQDRAGVGGHAHAEA